MRQVTLDELFHRFITIGNYLFFIIIIISELETKILCASFLRIDDPVFPSLENRPKIADFDESMKSPNRRHRRFSVPRGVDGTDRPQASASGLPSRTSLGPANLIAWVASVKLRKVAILYGLGEAVDRELRFPLRIVLFREVIQVDACELPTLRKDGHNTTRHTLPDVRRVVPAFHPTFEPRCRATAPRTTFPGVAEF
jgi:hypothetical protein